MGSQLTSDVAPTGPNGEPLIRKTPGVCGGDACVRDTRIMVWLLVAMKRSGLSDEEILRGYPILTAVDLTAAWDYYKQHPQETDEAIANQETED